MTWKEVTTSDLFREANQEERAEYKRQFFQKYGVPTLREQGLDDDELNIAADAFFSAPDDTGEGLLRSAVGSAARGFLDPIPSSLEVAGAFTGIESLEEAGQAVRGGIESMTPVNPAQQGFITDAAGVLGQGAQILATGGLGAATGLKFAGKAASEAARLQAAKFGAQAAQQAAMGSSAVAGGLERADQLGLEGGDRLLRGAIAGGTEFATEKLGGFASELGPIKKFLGDTPVGSIEGDWFGIPKSIAVPVSRGIVTEAGEEGLAEVAGQATDIAMAPEAAPEMDVKQVAYAMLLGGVGGAMFGGVEAAITPRTKRAFDGTTDFVPSTTPPPGMTVEEAEAADLLALDGQGRIIGYKKPPTPVTTETIEAELPVELVTPESRAIIDNVVATPEASATAAALARTAVELGESTDTQQVPTAATAPAKPKTEAHTSNQISVYDTEDEAQAGAKVAATLFSREGVAIRKNADGKFEVHTNAFDDVRADKRFTPSAIVTAVPIDQATLEPQQPPETNFPLQETPLQQEQSSVEELPLPRELPVLPEQQAAPQQEAAAGVVAADEALKQKEPISVAEDAVVAEGGGVSKRTKDLISPAEAPLPKGAGARKATKEGQARVDAAKQRLRDIINNDDIVGRQRADMIEDGNMLIAYLQATAGRDIETDYSGGDQIALTYEDAEDGFETFIYLEGSKAGKSGVRMKKETLADLQSKKQQADKDFQAGIRRVRESGKSDQLPKATPTQVSAEPTADVPTASLPATGQPTLGSVGVGAAVQRDARKLEIINELKERESGNHPLGRIPKARESTYQKLSDAFDRGYSGAEVAIEKRAQKEMPTGIDDANERVRIAKLFAARNLAEWTRKDLRIAKGSLPNPQMKGGRVPSAADYREIMYLEGKLAALKSTEKQLQEPQVQSETTDATPAPQAQPPAATTTPQETKAPPPPSPTQPATKEPTEPQPAAEATGDAVVTPKKAGAAAPRKITVWKAQRQVGDIKEGPRLGEFYSDNEQTANSLADLKGDVVKQELELKNPLVIPAKEDGFEFYDSSELNAILANEGVKFKFSDVLDGDEVWRHIDDGGIKLINALKKAGFDSIQFPEFLGGREQTTTLVFQKPFTEAISDSAAAEGPSIAAATDVGSVESQASQRLRDYIATLPAKAQAAWSQERLAAADSYYATGDTKALEPLTKTQQKVVRDNSVSAAESVALDIQRISERKQREGKPIDDQLTAEEAVRRSIASITEKPESSRAKAVQAGLAGLDWANMDAEQRRAAVNKFAQSTARSLLDGASSLKRDAKLTLHSDRPPSAKFNVSNGSLSIEIGTNVDFDSLSFKDNGESVLSQVFAKIEEEFIHAVHGTAAFERWKKSGSETNFNDWFEQETFKDWLSIFENIKGLRASGNNEAADVIENTIFEATSLYHQGIPAEMLGTMMQQQRPAYKMYMELARMLAQVQLDSFTSETEFTRFVKAVNHIFTKVLGLMRKSAELVKTGALGEALKRDVAMLSDSIKSLQESAKFATSLQKQPPSATTAEFVGDANALIDSLNEQTLQKERENREDGPEPEIIDSLLEKQSVAELPDSASFEEVQKAAPVSVANATAAAAVATDKAKWMDWLRSNFNHLVRFAEKIWKNAIVSIAAISATLSPQSSVNVAINEITPSQYVTAELVANPTKFGLVAPWVSLQAPPTPVSQNDLASYPAEMPPFNSGGESSMGMDTEDATKDMKLPSSPLDVAKRLAKQLNEETTLVMVPKRVAKYLLNQGSSPQVNALAEMLAENESDSPKIAQMLKSMGINESPDTFPWCATSVSFALTQAGKPTSLTSSRAFLGAGKKTDTPTYGDVVVMWNNNPATGGKSGWGGHVGFYLGKVGDSIAVLSGNVSDEVNVSLYSRDRVLGYRKVSASTNIVSNLRPSLTRATDGAVVSTGVNPTSARAARNSYIGVIPGAEQSWLGTVAEFEAEFGDTVNFGGGLTRPGTAYEALVTEDGRVFIFTDNVQILEGDKARSEQYGTTPGVEAVKRLMRHESFGHRGFMALPTPLKQRFVDLIDAGVIPEADLDSLVNDRDYAHLKDWRTVPATRQLAAEEWLAQRMERMQRIPKSGPMQPLLDWLRDVWRWLTGGETDDLVQLRDIMREMHRALGGLEQGQRIVTVGDVRAAIAQSPQAARHAALEAKFNAGTITAEETAEAEAIVAEAARRAGKMFGKWFHGSPSGERFEVFDPTKGRSFGRWNSIGSWFTLDKKAAEGWAENYQVSPEGDLISDVGNVYDSYLFLKKPLSLDGYDALLDLWNKTTGVDTAQATPADVETFKSALREQGYDGIVVSNVEGDSPQGADPSQTYAIALAPNQIKSAEPFTGVPLDQRFDSTSNDIRASRTSPIRNYPNLSSDKEKVTARKAKRRPISELMLDEDGMMQFVPRKYNTIKDFAGQMRAWVNDEIAPYGDSIAGLLELLRIIREDDVPATFGLGTKDSVLLTPWLISEAANRAKKLGSTDIRDRFLELNQDEANAAGTTLNSQRLIKKTFDENYWLTAAKDMERKSQEAVVDPKITSRTIGTVNNMVPEAGDEAAGVVGDAINEEEMIAVRVLELGVAAQTSPKMRGLLEELVQLTIDYGRLAEMDMEADRPSISARSALPKTKEERVALMEKIAKRQTEILKEIDAENKKAKASPAAKQPKPVETAKQIINKITSTAAKEPAKKKTPDAVRELYRKQLKTPMSDIEFTRAAKEAGLSGDVIKQLKDAIDLEIAAIAIEAKKRADKRISEKELKEAEDEESANQKKADAKINEVAERLSDPSLTQDKAKKVDEFREFYEKQVREPLPVGGFVDAMVALGVDEATARQLFDIAALDADSRQRVRDARADIKAREISEAQASRLIYSQEETLRQGNKDREQSPDGDSINKAFREQVAKPMPMDAFVERLGKLKVTKATAERMYRTAERVAVDNEAAILYKQRSKFLDVDTAALANFVNELRRGGKLTGKKIKWADLLSLPVAHQETIKAQLLERVKKHNVLRDLSASEQVALAEALEKIWQRERRKIFKRMIKRADLAGVSEDTQKVIAEAAPAMLRYINQGMLGTSAFYRAVGEKFGIEPFSPESIAKIEKLAAQMQEPGTTLFERDRLAKQLTEELQRNTVLPLAEVLSSAWVTSVLSGLATQMDMALNVSTGMLSIAKKVVASIISTKSTKEARAGLSAFGSGLIDAARIAWPNLLDKNLNLLPIDADSSMAFLADGGKTAGLGTGEKMMLRKGDKPQDKIYRALGAVLAFYNRLFSGLDFIVSSATAAGTFQMAAALNPQLYDAALIPSKQDKINAFKQAQIRLPSGTRAEQLAMSLRMLDDGAHLLGKKLDDAAMQRYKQMQQDVKMEGRTASYQEDPTGLGGVIYDSIKSATAGWADKADKARKEARQRIADKKAVLGDERNWNITAQMSIRLLDALYLLASQAQNALGLRFMRFAGNKFNELISYLPGIGAIRLEEEGMYRDGVRTLRGQNILHNQAIGLMAGTLFLWAMKALNEDDEERGWIVNGSWKNLTPERKKQQIDAGFKENSISFLQPDGTWRSYNYISWPLAGWLASFGAISDYKRLTPDKWDEKSLPSKIAAGMYAGVSSISDISSLSNLTEMFGRSSNTTDPAKNFSETLIRAGSSYVGGFVPKVIKDMETWIDGNYYKPEEPSDFLVKELPFFRRSIGAPVRDIFAEPIQIVRTPWRRIVQQSKDDEAYKNLAKLNARGLWLTPPNPKNRKVRRGGATRDLTSQEADAYVTEVGRAYKRLMEARAETFLKMPVERAEQLIEKATTRIREIALRKALSGARSVATVDE